MVQNAADAEDDDEEEDDVPVRPSLSRGKKGGKGAGGVSHSHFSLASSCQDACRSLA